MNDYLHTFALYYIICGLTCIHSVYENETAIKDALLQSQNVNAVMYYTYIRG